jgi:fatty-acyl-CoA synthase
MPERIALVARSLRWLPGLLATGPKARFSAADLFERRARRHPRRPFVRFEGAAWTYGEANAAANRIAHWALERGIGPGQTVALLMENRPEYLFAWLGLAKAGATVALLHAEARGAALAHALGESGARLVVAGAECADALASLDPEPRGALEIHVQADPSRPGLALPPGAKSLDEEAAGMSPWDPDRRVRAAVRGGDPLFLIYTSGTTGLPKAARFSHSRFMGGGSYALLAGFGRRDVLYCALPLHHTVGGVMCVNAVLRTGATLALARRFRASRFWQETAESGATAFQYVGELCRYLLAQPPGPHDRAHRVRLAVGNGLRADVWAAFQERFRVARIVEFYGATEANVSMVNFAGRVGSVGRPAPGLAVALVRFDPEREAPLRGPDGRCIRCADGEPGELLGRISEGRTAAGRFEGYTSREASEKKVLRDVFAAGDAWFRSGDLLRRDADGFYFFVDRIGDTFRWKGENVSTEEVARALDALPCVAQSVVYGVEVPGAEGRAGMAALLLRPGERFDGAALYAHVEQALPPAARPAFVRLAAGFETTATLKLKKGPLRDAGFDPARSPDPIFVRDDARRAFVPIGPAEAAGLRSGALRL